jgi:hypothetical protein
MFEAQQQEKSGKLGMWIGFLVILVVVAALAWYVMGNKGGAKSDTANPAASAPAATADPTHDLRVVTVKMDKDPTGTVAVWSVDLRNLSRTFGYKDIAYQTTYLGADDSPITQNTGKITLSLDPGDEQTTQFRDLLYPTGTARYTFKITGASTTK